MTIDLPFLDPVAVQDIGYAAVFFVLMLDGANIPFTPIELFLGLTGYLAAIGDLQFFPALLVTVIGNMTGHIISYLLGFTFGRKFFQRYGKYLLLTPDRLEQAERLFERLGPWSAFIFRFIPGLRTFGSILLGVLRQPIIPFMALSAAGVLIWNFVIMIIGFYFGVTFAEHARWIITLAIGTIAVGLSLAAFLWYLQSQRKKDRV